MRAVAIKIAVLPVPVGLMRICTGVSGDRRYRIASI
jgi:hypothetical protein